MPPTKPIDMNKLDPGSLPPGILPPGIHQVQPRLVEQGAPRPVPPPERTESKPQDQAPTVLCRHCGADPAADPEKIDVDDLVAFAQSVWRNEPFTQTRIFFGGAVKVVFRSLTTHQADAAQRAVISESSRADASSGVLGVLTLQDLVEEHQLALSIASLTVSDKHYEAPPTLDSRTAINAVRTAAGNHIAYQTIRKAYREFYLLTQRLIRAGADPSFWEATLPSGQSPASPTTATKA